jgi:hypothetical protein
MSGRLPNLIVAGVMKGGTTSLFTWLSQHPDFHPSRVKETRFFRPFYHPETGVDPEQLSLDDYRGFFEDAKDERFVFESTPGYINGGGRLARHLERNLPDLRVVFVLRDPIDRARSYFVYLQGLLYLPKEMTFAEYVGECLEREARDGVPAWFYRGLWGGRYAEPLREWSDVFGSRMRVLFFEDLKRDPRAFTDGLCRWLGARGLDEVALSFSVENKSHMPRNAPLHRLAMAANDRFEPFLRRNHALKKVARDLYYRFNAEKKKAPADDVAALANPYFAGPNAALRALLDARQPDVAQPPWLAGAEAAAAPVVPGSAATVRPDRNIPGSTPA